MASHVKAREKSDGDSAASISAKKNGSAAILHLHSRGRLHRFRGNPRAALLVFRSSLATFIILVERRSDGRARGLSFRTIVRLQNSHGELSLWKRAHSRATLVRGYLALYKYKENTNTRGRFVTNYISSQRVLRNIVSASFQRDLQYRSKVLHPPQKIRKTQLTEVKYFIFF